MTTEFRTIQKPLNYRGVINHRKRLMMIGSCFSDNIGQRLVNAFFDVNINPFGTLYNPASIARGISDILSHRVFTQEDLFQASQDNRYYSFSHHSDFSCCDASEMLELMNERLTVAHDYLIGGNLLIVTFGTAYVYRLNDSGNVVANCHKQPSAMFSRQLLEVDDIVAEWLPLIDRLRQQNPELKIIFTVSPIRHLADGAHDNQLSKSTLHLAIDRLVKRCEGLIYFPAYEIMNDDLRDYRFYATDMAHPTDVAIDYIYDIFGRSFYDDATQLLSVSCEKASRRLHHRHRTDDTETIARFKRGTVEILEQLKREHPELSHRCDVEIKKIEI